MARATMMLVRSSLVDRPEVPQIVLRRPQQGDFGILLRCIRARRGQIHIRRKAERSDGRVLLNSNALIIHKDNAPAKVLQEGDFHHISDRDILTECE
jgi:hypothetical protein